MTACIVGWAHSRFGKLEGETLESLIVKVARDAMEHAGIGPDDVDEIVLGHFNAGFSPQDFTASLVLQADDRLRFKPATRVENACATGSAAVRQGIRAIDARASRVVLVVGAIFLRGSQGSSARSPTAISSAMATSPMRWPPSPQRTTRTVSTIPMRRFARIWGTISAVRKAKRTRLSRVRSSARIARWCLMALPPWCSRTPRR